ncbi:UNVERIFIED_CONTAM: hypothetical protein FKN15_023415 [Acipenser sinensis]
MRCHLLGAGGMQHASGLVLFLPRVAEPTAEAGVTGAASEGGAVPLHTRQTNTNTAEQVNNEAHTQAKG